MVALLAAAACSNNGPSQADLDAAKAAAAVEEGMARTQELWDTYFLADMISEEQQMADDAVATWDGPDPEEP